MARYCPVFVLLLGLVATLNAQEQKRVKTYAVGDLVTEFNQALQPACVRPNPAAQPVPVEESTSQADDLIKLISGVVAPDSWAAHGGTGSIEYFPPSKALVVRQSPEVHKDIETVLDSLRQAQDVNIELNVIVARMPEACLQDMNIDVAADGANVKPVVVAPDQLQQLIQEQKLKGGVDVLASSQLRLRNGQASSVSVTRVVEMLTGMNIQSVNGRCQLTHQHEAIPLGMRFQAVAVAMLDHGAISLKCAGDVSELKKKESCAVTVMIRPEQCPEGEPAPFTQFIEVPDIKKVSVEKSAVVPLGKTLIMVIPNSAPECNGAPVTQFLTKLPYMDRLFKTVPVPVKEVIVFAVTPTINRVKGIEQRNASRLVDYPCPIFAQDAVACPYQQACAAPIAAALKTPPAALSPYSEPLPARIGPFWQLTAPEPVPAPLPVVPDERVTPCAAVPVITPCEGIKPCCAQETAHDVGCHRMNMADIVALSMSHISDEIILNQMRTTGAVFHLGAEEIIWLKKNGVSDPVVMAMQNSGTRIPDGLTRTKDIPQWARFGYNW